jgi:hypothetical protein
MRPDDSVVLPQEEIIFSKNTRHALQLSSVSARSFVLKELNTT